MGNNFLTTKNTKRTKFGVLIIRNLPVHLITILYNLRGLRRFV